MGRWAQQHRRGGAGARSSGNCIQILSAQIESGDPQFVDFTFSAPVDDSDFERRRQQIIDGALQPQ